MRTLDRIEQNIRFEKGHSHFHADQCVTKLKVKSTAEIRTGITYSFPAYLDILSVDEQAYFPLYIDAGGSV